MKITNVILASLLWLFATSSTAQSNNKQSYPGAQAQSFTSVDEAKETIDKIIATVGLKPKFEIKEANIPNAAAVIYGSKRYVLYNPNFVSSLNRAAGNQWASVSILAHEIGHHLNGHTLEGGGSNPAIELEADEFSGFVLRKMGATITEAQAAMKIAASQRASHTHPAQADRLYAIAKGWNNADNQITGKNNNVAAIYKKPEAARPVVVQQPAVKTQPQVARVSQSAIAEKYISKDAHFHYDRTGNYFVTVRNHLVKAMGDKLMVLGTLVANNSRNFPVAIIDDSNNYWLVNNSGKIITRSGREIGYISNHM